MLRTVQYACTQPKAEADALNAESGRIYTDMLVRHYRLYRKHGVWLAPKSGERLRTVSQDLDFDDTIRLQWTPLSSIDS